ncbi:hypothetical protein NW759_012980 [Fusarium solani]|nr:hypothetical protein NW759_012980 [Fusarium solani]
MGEFYRMWDNIDVECMWCGKDIEAGVERWIEQDWLDDGPAFYHYHDDCYEEYMEDRSDDDDEEEEGY